MNVQAKITPETISNIAAHLLAGSASRPAFTQLFNAKSAIIEKSVNVYDISFWNDRNDTLEITNFAKMKQSAAGVIIRAGQGSWDDSDFAANWSASRSVLPRGLYWFYDSHYSPGSQALRIKNLLMKHGMPDMEIWADYEETYNGAYAGWRHFSVFISEIERLIPWARVGIYTGYWYWLAHSPNPVTQKASFEWFARYPLWLAQYTDNPANVRIPKPWDKVTFWQWTSHGDGLAAGVESLNIDKSYYNGTLSQFQARYNLTPSIPPVIEPEPPVVVPDPVVSPIANISGLYYVDARKWSITHPGMTVPPGGGPLTQPMTTTPPKANNILALIKKWQNYIAKWNTPKDFERICSDDFGPTFGFNGAGLLKYIGLAYPGPVAISPRPNYVRVLETKTFGGQLWGRIDSISISAIPPETVNPTATPWLFHHVYGSLKGGGGYSVLNNTYTIPLLSAQGLPWWIPMSILTKVG